MVRKVRRHAKRRAWGPGHVSHLAFGFDYFCDAWGDPPYTSAVLEDMRAAYRLRGDEAEEAVREQHGTEARSWAAENLF